MIKIEIHPYFTDKDNISKVYDDLIVSANTGKHMDYIDNLEYNIENFGKRNVWNHGSGCGFGWRDQEFRVRKTFIRKFLKHIRQGTKTKIKVKRIKDNV